MKTPRLHFQPSEKSAAKLFKHWKPATLPPVPATVIEKSKAIQIKGTMNASAIITLIGSTASAVATVLLVILTAKYVKLTHALVEETQSTKFPNVFVDIELDSYEVKFIVGNAGSSPALNVRLNIKDSFPWENIGNNPTGLATLAIVQHGIDYLAPNRTLKFLAGYIQRNINFFAAGNTIEVGLTFDTETGKTVTRQFSIDLHSYSGILFESFQNPEREVAKAIRDAEHSRSLHNNLNTSHFLSQLGKKTCPSCGEQISSKATKCPKCHEFIKSQSNEDKIPTQD